jgi:hypothetical protein
LRPPPRTAPHRPLWPGACDPPPYRRSCVPRGDHFTRFAVLLADSPPEAEDVLEVAEPAHPADRYVLGALVRVALPRLQHRALEAVTIIEMASSTTPTT